MDPKIKYMIVILLIKLLEGIGITPVGKGMRKNQEV